MASKNQLRNLAISRGRLRNFVREAILGLSTEEHSFAVWRFTSRLEVLKSVRKVADELVNVLERCGIDNRHEWSLSVGDIKLHLKICQDGFIRGYVSHEFESNRRPFAYLNTLMCKFKLDDRDIHLEFR